MSNSWKNFLSLRADTVATGFIVGVAILLIPTGIGFALGGLARSSYPPPPILYPLPHQIPKYPGGVSFRFAMVHDVIHDRYPRHGKAYYRERNRRILAAIEKNKDAEGLPPADQFDLIDDLGVGLDSLGEHDEAVRWLRLKLKAQENLGLQGRALYTSYANLGTFLIHGASSRTVPREQIREGLDYLRNSIAVNPEAHFGREVWQAIVAEFMLAAATSRELLLKYDMVGNSLKWSFDPQHRRAMNPWETAKVRSVAAYLQDPKDALQAASLRGTITRVGAEDDWRRDVPGAHKDQVPFDEPCLGIIGMWRLGGGANPHFALALAETMARVNQRRLAWAAYHRAVREAKRFCPEEEIRTKFIEHCKARQTSLGFAAGEKDELERNFDSELQFGLEYQRAYQQYEEDLIAAGKDLNDPHFYDRFHSQHGEIATPIGQADFLAVEEPIYQSGMVVFGTGCGAFVGAMLLLAWQRWKPRKDAATSPNPSTAGLPTDVQ